MTVVFQANYTNRPLTIDGNLDKDIWHKCPSYPLYLSREAAENGKKLQESGEVKFAWNEVFFYVAASLEDGEIVALGQEDEMHHYRYGDVCELFLKPKGCQYYWELYVTPAGKKSSFFYPTRNHRGFPECLENYTCGLKVSASLSNGNSHRIGWNAEMAMPIKDLEVQGCSFIHEDWNLLVGRYNYSKTLDKKELSSSPQLSQMSFHSHEQYAKLELLKP